jgi:UDPglucose--hexose-1-phosphate uridylyltransferase
MTAAEPAAEASEEPARKTTIRLADGRELHYFGVVPPRPADYPDLRDLTPVQVRSQARWDPLLGEWVVVAGHRQDRTFQPAADQCPLCPSAPGRSTEIPAPAYDVVVFENRFPAFRSGQADQACREGLLAARPAGGQCEVVCFSQDHDASFADLSEAQVATVLAAWTDRSIELARLPGVAQVYCFENRGVEVGVTLPHPHGQIYAFPFVAPRTSRMLARAASYRQETGRNLFDDNLAAELAAPERIVQAGLHWVAFVPYAAHWPYEVHVYPRARVPGLTALSAPARAEFGALYLDLLGRFDRLFDSQAPYISAWHQAPVRPASQDFALHLELFTIRRAPGKLKYLAGSESGMGAFANDVAPEAAAERLRQLG